MVAIVLLTTSGESIAAITMQCIAISITTHTRSIEFPNCTSTSPPTGRIIPYVSSALVRRLYCTPAAPSSPVTRERCKQVVAPTATSALCVFQTPDTEFGWQIAVGYDTGFACCLSSMSYLECHAPPNANACPARTCSRGLKFIRTANSKRCLNIFASRTSQSTTRHFAHCLQLCPHLTVPIYQAYYALCTVISTPSYMTSSGPLTPKFFPLLL